jgi:sialate O-acetylesterase
MKSLLAFLLLLSCLTARGELWMPSIFGSGMVLQTDKPVAVWGEAEVGTEITVEFAGQKKLVVADASKRWKVVLDSMPASEYSGAEFPCDFTKGQTRIFVRAQAEVAKDK